jgi:hypothetical protein
LGSPFFTWRENVLTRLQMRLSDFRPKPETVFRLSAQQSRPSRVQGCRTLHERLSLQSSSQLGTGLSSKGVRDRPERTNLRVSEEARLPLVDFFSKPPPLPLVLYALLVRSLLLVARGSDSRLDQQDRIQVDTSNFSHLRIRAPQNRNTSEARSRTNLHLA